MERTTITLAGQQYDVDYIATGGWFKGDWMTPPDPIEVEVIEVTFMDEIITPICDLAKVETAILEQL